MSNWFDETEIAKRAEKYATERVINEEKVYHFKAGVEWTLEQFIKMLHESPYEHDPGVKRMCDDFRLRDFKRLVERLTAKDTTDAE